METYTPGHSKNASSFMQERTFESHGTFFSPYLDKDSIVLDCGCGPGSITTGMASKVPQGHITGIDFGQSQIEKATQRSSEADINNVTFRVANIYSLPFEDNYFDRVFSHALMEHLSDPQKALQQIFQTLKPQGIIGLCSPDWGGFILSPSPEEVSNAVEAYKDLQIQNGGDVYVGRKLHAHLESAGFKVISTKARYECYDSLGRIGTYLALQLEQSGDKKSARIFRKWSQQENGMFAQAWVSAVAVKP